MRHSPSCSPFCPWKNGTRVGRVTITSESIARSGVSKYSGVLYFPLMRIAVIGLGFMGSTHLKALRDVPTAQLVAVVSSDDKKLAGDLSGIQGNIGGPGEKMDFSGVKKYRTLSDA